MQRERRIRKRREGTLCFKSWKWVCLWAFSFPAATLIAFIYSARPTPLSSFLPYANIIYYIHVLLSALSFLVERQLITLQLDGLFVRLTADPLESVELLVMFFKVVAILRIEKLASATSSSRVFMLLFSFSHLPPHLSPPVNAPCWRRQWRLRMRRQICPTFHFVLRPCALLGRCASWSHTPRIPLLSLSLSLSLPLTYALLFCIVVAFVNYLEGLSAYMGWNAYSLC